MGSELTSRTGANASECAGAAASVLFVQVCVAQLLGHGAVSQPDLDVGQVPPVGPRRQRNVAHAAFDQGAHVLREGDKDSVQMPQSIVPVHHRRSWQSSDGSLCRCGPSGWADTESL